ncbi:hypothetical protein MASR1M45_01540 [Candidatus Kapaibacterium sp.]
MKKIIISVFIVFISSFATSQAGILQDFLDFFKKIPIWPVTPNYGEVYIREHVDRCQLYCDGGGYLECTWENGFNDCNCCYVERVVASNANIDQMKEHAESQINLGINNGSYSSQIIHQGVIYYRTVVWEYDELLEGHNINITVTHEE